MDHDTCSRLLRAYVSGDAGEDAPAIARHLQECRQCQIERAGLEALLAPVEPLTAGERARLHAGVAEATQRPSAARLAPLAPSGSAASTHPTGRDVRASRPGAIDRRRLPRLAPALSAAAAILLVIGGVILFHQVGQGRQGVAAAAKVAPGSGAHAPEPARSQSQGKAGAVGSLPLPTFVAEQTASPATEPRTSQVEAQASTVATAFARAYSGSQARLLAPHFLDRLVAIAPPALRSQVRQCGSSVLATSSTTALPFLASRATLNGKQVLALAFARASATPGKPLTRLTVEAWVLGSCGNPVLESDAAIPR
jgi:hypothetical protein